MVSDLRVLIHSTSPNLVFLCETHLVSQKVESLKYKLGFHYFIQVDSIGKSEGLALLWNYDWNVSLHSFSKRHINAHVTLHDGQPWPFFGF